jgi:putative endonuclease
MQYYAYFARCNDGSLYAGYTTDLDKREKAHNEGKGARYTRVRRPIRIVYSEQFKTRSEAQKREYEFKQLPKKDKESLAMST